MREVWIVSVRGTPVGSFLGELASVSAPKLGSVAIKAALERAGIPADTVGEVYMGCVLPAGVGQAPARQAALGAGIPPSVPCTTVNKVCGSGLKSVILGAQAILAGDTDVVVAGGMESMSQSPYILPRAREGFRMGHQQMLDSMIVDGLWDVYNQIHMGQCAELCAKEKNITRAQQDAFAAESYRRALTAQKEGRFKAEIAPVEVEQRKGPPKVVAEDEEPRRGDIEKLGGLRPAFQKDGTVTAGNASSINDGGAAVVLMEAAAARARNIKPLARIVSWGQHAQAPEWFTTAPAGSIENATKRAGWAVADVDLWEINEAFAVVSLANAQMLGLDAAKVNVNGGAVALGHPIGASGARILTTLLYAMAARGAKKGGASLCIGGGEGIALLVEKGGVMAEVKAIGVIGTGQMGGGIAQVAAQAGLDVMLLDANPEFAARAKARIGEILGKLVSKGKLEAAARDATIERLHPVSDYAALAACQFVVEAAPEDEALKVKIFHAMDDAAPKDAILASNTSSISITKLGGVTRRPEKVIGMHFMNPVPLMKLVEVVRGLPTSDETYQATVALAERFGKTTIAARDIPGFIVNRVLIPLLNEACYALYEGLGTASDIDKGVKLGLNHPMGPLELADLIGLDTCLAIAEVLHNELGDDKYRPCPLLRQYVAAGWFGRKVGRGFYRYDDKA